ncbi:S-layer homology domain-containing protein [Halalkalibacter nanhaiisediminis]|uniref:Spore germination protein YaaH n=1 Tax=Halalkalibacter nanhaiisediminis TaxID=688079 RepID=A0A562QR23_9BACI|nr:S-layer homology domain-containing protein [Halalkalibacter nanhaiisediminis]TWI59157.1 spore germination protein YaaH [Halalkalibacter nanhaiisediminis]
MNSRNISIGVVLLIVIFLMGGSFQSAQQNRFNMSYIYFGSPSNYVNQVNKTRGSLHTVSPNYFDVSKEGELIITWKLQESFISEMHKRGIKVVPFLANHWDRTAGINGLLNRDQIARDIASAIKQYNLDGVNVDIEGIGHEYRDAHTDLIRLLRKYIPKDKVVSVSVAANPNGWKTGWHGFYNYKALAGHSDYLMIMAYDESWESTDSPIGPVASIGFSERSIEYALNQGVQKEKIVHGIPFYGRIWKLDGPTLENRMITGKGLSITNVTPLMKEFNGHTYFDENKQAPYTTFQIPKGKYTFIGSTKLTEGRYQIWYENERSIKAKLRLTNRYDIKGTGSWALLHETPDVWDYYSLWLNGRYFVDVPLGNWAEGSIYFVSVKGWMNGTTNTTFLPNKNLTRAQSAVILIRALGYGGQVPVSYHFKDTIGHWAQNEIELAKELGFLNGVSPERFAPNEPLTREQLATILYNIFQFEYSDPESSPFTDVAINHWSYQPVTAIYQKGYLSGYEDGTFRPKAPSTRAQMAALLERMAIEFEDRKSNL